MDGVFRSFSRFWQIPLKKVNNVINDCVLLARDEMVGIGEGQRKRFFGVSFHPLDRNVFVTGGWDKLLRFWDLRVHKSTGCFLVFTS